VEGNAIERIVSNALACAALLPDLVLAAASIASPAPYLAEGLDWMSRMGEGNIEEFGAALDGKEALETFIEMEAPGILNAQPEQVVQAFQSLISPVDAAVLTVDFAGFLITQMHEGLENSRQGWIDDDMAFIKPWGFDLSQIRIPVLLMHGEQDRFVPFSHGVWLAGKIDNVDARLSTDDGHLTLAVNSIPDVHAWLLGKMS